MTSCLTKNLRGVYALFCHSRFGPVRIDLLLLVIGIDFEKMAASRKFYLQLVYTFITGVSFL